MKDFRDTRMCAYISCNNKGATVSKNATATKLSYCELYLKVFIIRSES